MSKIKLTKNALRDEQQRLLQLERYLPTIKLKKGLLQQEVFKAHAERERRAAGFEELKKTLFSCENLFVRAVGVDFADVIKIRTVVKGVENIAGIELPVFVRVDFEPAPYHLFDTPLWTDSLVDLLRRTIVAREEMVIAEERARLLEEELREVSVRVNLFEKIMIPRTGRNIKKIRVFLSDQQLMAVCQAKAAQKRVRA